MIYPLPPSSTEKNPQRIGLFGGSFNPAHAAHLEMSRFALKRLELDQVWWLVSPQNPLKSRNDMLPLAERLREAQEIAANDPSIWVSDLEARLNTQYTVDTLAALKALYPQMQFIWLMGADNLAQMPKWKDWRTIFQSTPIAVFQRAGYDADDSVVCEAAQVFASARLKAEQAPQLAAQAAPAWLVLDNPINLLSATDIRRQRNLT